MCSHCTQEMWAFQRGLAKTYLVSLRSVFSALQVNTHYPMEIPEYEKESLFAPLRKISNIEMEAQIVSTSDAVKALSPSQRKCKKPEEDGLMMWPIYTSLMCTLECKYSLIKKKCGCHPHFARPMRKSSLFIIIDNL